VRSDGKPLEIGKILYFDGSWFIRAMLVPGSREDFDVRA
jgi:hypothetical protein